MPPAKPAAVSAVAATPAAARRITALVRWLKWTIGQPRWRAWRSSVAVGVDGDGMSHRLEHRQIAGRVAVGVALGEVEALPAGDLAASPRPCRGRSRTARRARRCTRRRRPRCACRCRPSSRASAASGSTISTGDADTMYVARPAWRWRSSRRRASGRILSSRRGSTSALRATRSSWRIPVTAPRMRSRTAADLSSLGPAHLEQHRRHTVASELAGPEQPGTSRRGGEHERRRAGDQRAIEVEERRARPTRRHRHVLAHVIVVAERLQPSTIGQSDPGLLRGSAIR